MYNQKLVSSVRKGSTEGTEDALLSGASPDHTVHPHSIEENGLAWEGWQCPGLPCECRRMAVIAIAASLGHAGVVACLLRYDADPDPAVVHVIDNHKRGRFLGDNLKIIKLLYELGACPNKRFLYAVDSVGCVDMVCLALAHGANINGGSPPPLVTAAKTGREPLLNVIFGHSAAALWTADRVDVNASDSHGKTALMWAVCRGDIALLEKLAGMGANVNACQWDGMTALMEGVVRGDEAVVARLIEMGANVNAACLGGDTALMLAVPEHASIANQLIAAGALVDAKSASGTALIKAVVNNSLECVDLLLAAKANVHVANAGGLAAVSCAVADSNNPAILDRLLEREPSLASNAELPIAAVQADSLHAIHSLVEHGANLNVVGGTTPLAAAVIAGHPDCVFHLLASGADASACVDDRGGPTPIELACECARDALTTCTEGIRSALQIVAFLCVFGAVKGPTPFTRAHWCPWIQASFDYTRFEMALAVCDRKQMGYLLRAGKLDVYAHPDEPCHKICPVQRPRWTPALCHLAAMTNALAGTDVNAFIDLAVKWSPRSHHLHPNAKNRIYAVYLLERRLRGGARGLPILPIELWVIVGGFCGRISHQG